MVIDSILNIIDAILNIFRGDLPPQVGHFFKKPTLGG